MTYIRGAVIVKIGVTFDHVFIIKAKINPHGKQTQLHITQTISVQFKLSINIRYIFILKSVIYFVPLNTLKLNIMIYYS